MSKEHNEYIEFLNVEEDLHMFIDENNYKTNIPSDYGAMKYLKTLDELYKDYKNKKEIATELYPEEFI